MDFVHKLAQIRQGELKNMSVDVTSTVAKDSPSVRLPGCICKIIHLFNVEAVLMPEKKTKQLWCDIVLHYLLL